MTAGDARGGRRYRALGHEFTAHSADTGVARVLDELLTDLRVDDGRARHRYELVDREGVGDDAGWELRLDGRPVGPPGPAWTAVARLLWCVNRGAARDTRAEVLLHAGAVCVGDAGVIVAGAAGSGKSTLVAALVRAGAAYLTDEVVALDRVSDALVGYPRPLSLDPGSWPLLPELGQFAVSSSRRLLPHQWQVPASRLSGGRTSTRPSPRLVVLPREGAADPSPRILRPTETVVALAACAFPTGVSRGAALRRLARLAEQVRCVEVGRGDLSRTVGDVVALAELPPVRGAPRPPVRTSASAPRSAASPRIRYHRRPSATLVQVGGGGLIEDDRTAALHEVNGTGVTLWELLDRPRCVEELTGSLARSYDWPVADVAAEVEAFLDALRAADLVTATG